MRQLIILGVVVIGTLGIGNGNAEAAPSMLLRGLTSLPIIDVGYYPQYPPPYYYRGRHSYVSPHCYNKDEIRELQRLLPETKLAAKHEVFPLSLDEAVPVGV
jgi:hypothetical protein